MTDTDCQIMFCKTVFDKSKIMELEYHQEKFAFAEEEG